MILVYKYPLVILFHYISVTINHCFSNCLTDFIVNRHYTLLPDFFSNFSCRKFQVIFVGNLNKLYVIDDTTETIALMLEPLRYRLMRSCILLIFIFYSNLYDFDNIICGIMFPNILSYYAFKDFMLHNICCFINLD